MITVLVCAVLLAEVAVVCCALARLISSTREALAARQLMCHLAHELRAPLDAIMMRAANLRTRSLSTKTRRDVESIELITARISALVSSVLDTAAIRAGRFSVSQEPCEPQLLLRDVTEMADSAAAAKQIRLSADVMHPQTNVLADGKRIVQVLSNLLDNAVKFTPEQGRITISTARSGPMMRFMWVEYGSRCGTIFYFTLPLAESAPDEVPSPMSGTDSPPDMPALRLMLS